MIIHLDIDCFFVSAHRIFDKSLLNRAVAVGGRSNLSIFDKGNTKREISTNSGAFVSSILTKNSLNSDEYYKDEKGRIRGIITTSSYEARACGVRTAMSVNEALSLCPHLKMIAPDYSLYHDLSKKLESYLYTKTPYVEQFSIDEFFIDVRGWVDEKDILLFSQNLKDEIWEKFRLPISIGISNTKYISKLATNEAKPNRIKMIKQEELYEYIKDKPISFFPGIGKAYERKLLANGIRKLGQIFDKKELFYSWKKPGIQLYNRVCGVDKEKVIAKTNSKSIGLGRSFDPIFCRVEIKRRVAILSRYISFLVNKQNITPQTFYLKIKYEYGAKSKEYINTNRLFNEIFFKESMQGLFEKIDNHKNRNIIQLNIIVSNFIENRQHSYNLFNYEEDKRNLELTKKLNKLRDKYGVDIIKNANEL